MSRPFSTTSLTKFAGSMREADPEGAQRAARQLWHERGIIVLFPDDDLTGMARVIAEGVATAKYGRRK